MIFLHQGVVRVTETQRVYFGDRFIRYIRANGWDRFVIIPSEENFSSLSQDELNALLNIAGEEVFLRKATYPLERHSVKASYSNDQYQDDTIQADTFFGPYVGMFCSLIFFPE